MYEMVIFKTSKISLSLVRRLMRRIICSEAFNLDHLTYCINKTFHSEFKEGCLCIVCLKPICAYATEKLNAGIVNAAFDYHSIVSIN